jgi:hypothetical protein
VYGSPRMACHHDADQPSKWSPLRLRLKQMLVSLAFHGLLYRPGRHKLQFRTNLAPDLRPRFAQVEPNDCGQKNTPTNYSSE